eukprot:169717-Pelagomonas_calceolata.AAC.2
MGSQLAEPRLGLGWARQGEAFGQNGLTLGDKERHQERFVFEAQLIKQGSWKDGKDVVWESVWDVSVH